MKTALKQVKPSPKKTILKMSQIYLKMIIKIKAKAKKKKKKVIKTIRIPNHNHNRIRK